MEKVSLFFCNIFGEKKSAFNIQGILQNISSFPPMPVAFVYLFKKMKG